QRDQHVAVHLASQFLLAAFQRKECVLPRGQHHIKAIAVVACRLHVAHLKERPCSQHAVVVGEEEAAVRGKAATGAQVGLSGGRSSKLCPKETLVCRERRDDRGRYPDTLVEFLENVIVDQ